MVTGTSPTTTDSRPYRSQLTGRIRQSDQLAGPDLDFDGPDGRLIRSCLGGVTAPVSGLCRRMAEERIDRPPAGGWPAGGSASPPRVNDRVSASHLGIESPVAGRRRLEKHIERRIRRSIDSRHGSTHVVAQLAADVSAHVVINRGGSAATSRQQDDAGKAAPPEEEEK